MEPSARLTQTLHELISQQIGRKESGASPHRARLSRLRRAVNDWAAFDASDSQDARDTCASACASICAGEDGAEHFMDVMVAVLSFMRSSYAHTPQDEQLRELPDLLRTGDASQITAWFRSAYPAIRATGSR